LSVLRQRSARHHSRANETKLGLRAALADRIALLHQMKTLAEGGRERTVKREKQAYKQNNQ